jgi:hypothetical protein
VLTDHWADADEDPITREEVNAVIEKDPELQWEDTRDYQGEHYCILWKGQHAFYYTGSQIVCSGVDDEKFMKAIRLADALEAYTLGEDGERYQLRWLLFGGEELVITPP